MLVGFLWLRIISGQFADLIWVAYLTFGVGVGITQAAHFTYLPELSAPDKRPVTIAIFGAVTGVLAGLAPMLWGLALRTGGDQPGIDLANFAIFFYTIIGLCAAGIWLANGLPDSRSGIALARRR